MQPGQPEPNLTHDCKVMDGAVIIHCLPTSVSAFHEYAGALFIPYLEKQLHGVGCCMRPYISYCCEIWGNTYKTRIQPLYIIQKRAIRICNHLEYRSHSKPAFFNLKTLTIADLVQFKSMVLMYKIYNNLMPSNILSYFCMVHMSHDHDTRQAGHFKNMYCRTTLKSMCLSVRGPVTWNKLHTDLKNSTSVNMFKKRYKTFLVSEYAVT